MTNKRRPCKTYTKEFKMKAIRLMATPDKPSAEIARELGLRRNQLYKWEGRWNRPAMWRLRTVVDC
jgi:transposase